jgi:hypothetical protein
LVLGLTRTTLKRIDTFEDTKDAVKQSANEDDVEMEASNDTPAGGKQYDVLIRCTNGSDVNFSTRVSRQNIAPILLPPLDSSS